MTMAMPYTLRIIIKGTGENQVAYIIIAETMQVMEDRPCLGV